ncbi:hypothetical protein Goshw_024525, partial [Gossypium schwendimanii]|nr:hypothetical protein [Gossypium schwendimanii]
MKRFAANPTTTPEYDWWWGKRINDNVLLLSQKSTHPIEKHLHVIPFELEIVKQDSKKKSLELWKRIEKALLESRDEKVGLRAWVTELERSLHQHHSRNSMIELKASLSKIEELKRKKSSRLHCKIVNFEDRDHITSEALTQIHEVADHLQTLAVHAYMLSLKYESESDRGREFAWFLRKVKALSIR